MRTLILVLLAATNLLIARYAEASCSYRRLSDQELFDVYNTEVFAQISHNVDSCVTKGRYTYVRLGSNSGTFITKATKAVLDGDGPQKRTLNVQTGEYELLYYDGTSTCPNYKTLKHVTTGVFVRSCRDPIR